MSGHGGKREGAGRKPFPQELKRVTVTLTQEQIAYFKQLGEGSLSRGIRRMYDERTR